MERLPRSLRSGWQLRSTPAGVGVAAGILVDGGFNGSARCVRIAGGTTARSWSIRVPRITKAGRSLKMPGETGQWFVAASGHRDVGEECWRDGTVALRRRKAPTVRRRRRIVACTVIVGVRAAADHVPPPPCGHGQGAAGAR